MFLVGETRYELLAVSASGAVVARVKHQKRVFVTFDTSEEESGPSYGLWAAEILIVYTLTIG
jgi:hypothetical protein